MRWGGRRGSLLLLLNVFAFHTHYAVAATAVSALSAASSAPVVKGSEAVVAPANVAQPAPDLLEFHPRADFFSAFGFLGDKQNQYTIGSATAVFMLARSNDDDARTYFAGKRRIGDLDYWGNEILGTGVPGGLLGVGAWVWGAKRQSVKLVHFGQANLEAMFVTGVASATLKATVLRERPDHSDRYSFPSAHTSTMAATAMTLFEFYGWQAGVPAFVLTALTAVSRMSTDRHWFSDTVGGATLGLVFGHVFARAHLERVNPDSLKSQATSSGKTRILNRLTWVPVVDEVGNMGVVAVSFF